MQRSNFVEASAMSPLKIFVGNASTFGTSPDFDLASGRRSLRFWRGIFIAVQIVSALTAFPLEPDYLFPAYGGRSNNRSLETAIKRDRYKQNQRDMDDWNHSQIPALAVRPPEDPTFKVTTAGYIKPNSLQKSDLAVRKV